MTAIPGSVPALFDAYVDVPSPVRCNYELRDLAVHLLSRVK